MTGPGEGPQPPASAQRLAAELAAMSRLHELVGRLLVSSDLRAALDEVLAASIEITGAAMGNVQLLDPSAQVLEIVAHRGFGQEFLDHFRSVTVADESACSRALATAERVVIEDVQAEPSYAPHREVAAAAGYRAVQSTPLLSRNGELLGVLSTHYPEPKRPSEHELRTLDLYARQAAEFIEHVRGREALREADRRKDEFLAMLGHELRNPLAPIFTAVALLRHPDLAEERRAELLDVIERQGHHLARLVDDLLDVSRITRGKIRLRREVVDLRRMVEEALETHRPRIGSEDQRLDVSLPEEEVPVEGDPVRLQQIVGNLVHNASKFSPRGGRIAVRLAVEDGEAVVEVTDEGAGMDEEVQRQAFELFAQADRSLARSEGGLGVGLTTVKRLVEMHGGSVRAGSEGPGRGSVFTVRLPLTSARAAAADTPAAAAGAPEPGRTRRILVVDDNADAACGLADLLRLAGHECWVAAHGAEALDLFHEHQPDVVLLDIGLPGMDGYEVAERIRQTPVGQDALLVALTGYGKGSLGERDLATLFDRHLLKPADPKALGRILA